MKKHLYSATEVKYLGVILDTKLNFSLQVMNTTNKAIRAIWACRRMLGRNWGLKPKMMHWLYIMVVIPILKYGSLIWWERTKLGNCKIRLAKVQRLACLSITGAMTTTPGAALEAILELPPLHLVIEKEAIMAAYRFRINLSLGTHVAQTELDTLNNFAPLLMMRSDRMLPKLAFSKTFQVVIPNREDWEQGRCNLNGLIWYTDGSKSSTGAGAGYWGKGVSPGTSVSLGTYPTVFQAEVMAITCCTHDILQRNYENRRIYILSDSQSALKALNATRFSSRLTWECQKLLNELGTNNRVKLMWVPGHQGVSGNEIADDLAKRGSETSPTGPEPTCGISYGTVKSYMKDWMGKKHGEEWRSAIGMRHSKLFIPDLNNRRSGEILELNRPKINLITGLLTGHCKLRKHLHTMGLFAEPNCRLCGADEKTPVHLICYCEALSTVRYMVFGQLEVEDTQVHKIAWQLILDFIRRTGLLPEN